MNMIIGISFVYLLKFHLVNNLSIYSKYKIKNFYHLSCKKIIKSKQIIIKLNEQAFN